MFGGTCQGKYSSNTPAATPSGLWVMGTDRAGAEGVVQGTTHSLEGFVRPETVVEAKQPNGRCWPKNEPASREGCGY